MIKEEILFNGQKLLERKDWVWMNDRDIADALGMHAEDFLFYFSSKHRFEKEVIQMYSEQHLLDAKTSLSCCFQRPIKRVKKYLVYLTETFVSKPNMSRMLFSTLTGGILHKEVSKPFVEQLSFLLASCLKETFKAIRLKKDDLQVYSKETLQSILDTLNPMDTMERSVFFDRVRESNELLSYPESNALSQFSF
jgi:hypothetical protein